jgi:hypothetical protein
MVIHTYLRTPLSSTKETETPLITPSHYPYTKFSDPLAILWELVGAESLTNMLGKETKTKAQEVRPL